MKFVNIFVLSFWALSLISCGGDSAKNEFTGVLEGTSVQTPALTGGKILQMWVDTGHEVAVDDTIAVTDTTELALKVRQLEAASEELTSQIQLAEIALKQAKADLDYVRERYNRTLILHQQNTATQQRLDDVSNQLKRAETQQQSAQQQLKTLKARSQQIRADRKLIEKRMDDAIILAPFSGIIGTKYFERGEAIPPGTPIVEIIDLNVLNVKIYISEKMLSQVKHGQEAEIRVDGSDEKFRGNISWISPKAEFTPKSVLTPETRTSLVYAVNVKVENREGILKHGMPVVVRLVQDKD